jgi:hypothetical protein
MTCNAVCFSTLVVHMITGYAVADEGVVERTNVCRKGTLIIKTADDMYVAATQAGVDDLDPTPWSDDSEPQCAFFAGERVNGDLSGYGTVTLINSSGKECDYVIEGSGFSMQDAVQMLGCE